MNLKNATLKLLVALSCIFAICIMPVFTAAGDVKPKAGDVIDASNIEQYKDYFPDFMQRFIKDGWGLEIPTIVHVQDYKENLLPKYFRDATESNRGKVTLNEDGTLSGYDYRGFPFAEIKEPNKAMKIMWNNYYKYKGDDFCYPKPFMGSGKRKGGRVTYGAGKYWNIKYVGRLMIPPINIKNPYGLLWSSNFVSESPGSNGLYSLTWRYLDLNKSDDMWAYIPTLRRTIRMISSERSNPVQGSSMSYDDQYGWDGNIFNFEYKLVEEKSLLQIMNCSEEIIMSKYPEGYNKAIMTGPDFPYELREVYVVEVRAKDQRYPESKRYLWILKENFIPSYSQNYDKNGELWKGMANVLNKAKTGQGETAPFMSNAAIDLKTGIWMWALGFGVKIDAGIKPDNFLPGNFFLMK